MPRMEEPVMSRINSALTGFEPKTFQVVLSGEKRMVTTPFSSFTTAAPKPGELTGASPHALRKENQQLVRKVRAGTGGGREKGIHGKKEGGQRWGRQAFRPRKREPQHGQ